MLNGLFQGEKDGITSLRRVSAFLLLLVCCAACVLSLVLKVDKWLALIVIGLSGGFCCFILGLINAEDIAKITSALKNK